MGEKCWPNGAWDMHPGFFYMPQICDMGPIILLPFRKNYTLVFICIVCQYLQSLISLCSYSYRTKCHMMYTKLQNCVSKKCSVCCLLKGGMFNFIHTVI